MAAACGGGDGASRAAPAAAAAGPAAIDVVRVVEQSLDVPAVAARRADGVSVGGHLPEGHRIREDRQRRPRLESPRGRRCWPHSKRPNSWRSGRKRSRNCRRQRRSCRWRARRLTPTRARSTRLKAASATPGVVAGNDVVIAEKTADASAEPGPRRSAECRSGPAGAQRHSRHGRVPASDGPVRRRHHRTKCASRGARGPRRVAPARRHCCGSSTPIGSGSSCRCPRPTQPR